MPPCVRTKALWTLVPLSVAEVVHRLPIHRMARAQKTGVTASTQGAAQVQDLHAMKWTHHVHNAGQMRVPMIGAAGCSQPQLQRQHQHRRHHRAAPVASSGINVVERLSQEANVANQGQRACLTTITIRNASRGPLLRRNRP